MGIRRATAWTNTCSQPTIYPWRKFFRVQHLKDEAKIEWVSWLCRCLFSGVSHWFHPLNFCGYFLKGIPFYAVHLLLSIHLSTPDFQIQPFQIFINNGSSENRSCTRVQGSEKVQIGWFCWCITTVPAMWLPDLTTNTTVNDNRLPV